MRKLYCFLLIQLLMCAIFFLTNIHDLQVLLGHFLLLTYSQLPTHPSSVFRLQSQDSFHLESKQKEKSNLQTNSPWELSQVPCTPQPQTLDADGGCWRNGLPSWDRAPPEHWFSWECVWKATPTKGGGEGKGRRALRGGLTNLLLEVQIKLPLKYKSHLTELSWKVIFLHRINLSSEKYVLLTVLKPKGTLVAEGQLASWTK